MEDRDDYPIILQPHKKEHRIELEAQTYADKKTKQKKLNEQLFSAFVAGAANELQRDLNACIDKLNVDLLIQKKEMEKELASLKEENAKLKFRADLMAIYKQEKEDRDKILHQIKCTLYDRLTETEKLNDILKFFPTALKTFSDNK